VEHRGPKGPGRVDGVDGGQVWGGGAKCLSALFPENFLTLDLQMVIFGAFWWFFSAIQLPALHAKTGAFELPKFAVAIHCCISS